MLRWFRRRRLDRGMRQVQVHPNPFLHIVMDRKTWKLLEDAEVDARKVGPDVAFGSTAVYFDRCPWMCGR